MARSSVACVSESFLDSQLLSSRVTGNLKIHFTDFVYQALSQLAHRSARAGRFSPAELRPKQRKHHASIAESCRYTGPRHAKGPQKLLTT
jgi:hypothetical protein